MSFLMNFFLQNCQKVKKLFYTVKLVTQLIFDLHESNMPQKKGIITHFLALFLYKFQKLIIFCARAQNTNLIFAQTPFVYI